MRAEIRRLEPQHLSATVDVWVRAQRDAQPRLEERMGFTDEQYLAFFRDVICVKHQVWVAVEGATVLGLIALDNGEIDQLYVAPELQRQGIGSALLDQARELSPEWLGLFTHQRNEKARRFYEARGFAAVRFGISPAPENEPDVRYEWHRDQQPSPAAD